MRGIYGNQHGVEEWIVVNSWGRRRGKELSHPSKKKELGRRRRERGEERGEERGVGVVLRRLVCLGQWRRRQQQHVDSQAGEKPDARARVRCMRRAGG